MWSEKEEEEEEEVRVRIMDVFTLRRAHFEAVHSEHVHVVRERSEFTFVSCLLLSSVLQAFAVCVSSFDTKVACE